MKKYLAAGASALALAASPVAAQHEHHIPPAPPPPHEEHPAPEGQEPVPAPVPEPAHEGHDMATATEATAVHGGHALTGVLGSYPMNREASGTAWQPDSSPHGALHLAAGRWTLMAHASLHGVYDRQGGARGGEKGFVSGMLMGMARRPLGTGTLQLRASLSPDPLMGRRGYPLLLAAGETANGVETLIDRQHPHDLFMELSASYSVPLSKKASLFLYGGLPGEPAFGPPAFMHRLAAMDSPEAPISHHWLDSTHITFGVVTAGLVVGQAKLEASRFNAREPDQRRFDIETGPLDSTALRLSWNPARSLSIQASWGRLIAPEQLEPDENETRWSASAIHTRPLGDKGRWSTTLAWGRRTKAHDRLDALVLESAIGLDRWTLFGRAERIETDELTRVGGHHGPVYEVGKASLGAIRDFPVAPRVKLGLGGLVAFSFVPRGLEPAYSGDPKAGMLFLRLKLD
ncbi:MAG TPA: hypothetical protein VF548_09165 [Allosphingosinicella sp.]|jgi:hypothetical protein